jgi:hypothetical protein
MVDILQSYTTMEAIENSTGSRYARCRQQGRLEKTVEFQNDRGG